MKITILSLFPNMFEGFLAESIIKRAIQNEKVEVKIINFRDYSVYNNKQVDDTPYGGGAGMVLRCEPLFAAIRDLKTEDIVISDGEKAIGLAGVMGGLETEITDDIYNEIMECHKQEILDKALPTDILSFCNLGSTISGVVNNHVNCKDKLEEEYIHSFWSSRIARQSFQSARQKAYSSAFLEHTLPPCRNIFLLLPH